MKIGIFDSGLGGLAMMHEIKQILPEYEYVFYGDTLHVPYGERTPEDIIELTKRGVDFLFKQDCLIVILACNTASAVALKYLQENYLPEKDNANLRILGIIVPTAETLISCKKIGVLATERTVSSHSFNEAFARYGWHGTIIYQACPQLVPLIESGLYKEAEEILENMYLPFLLKEKIDAIVLGCTHYMLLKDKIHTILPEHIKLISQDEIIPIKLKNYLTDEKHADKNKLLTKNKTIEIYVTKQTKEMSRLGEIWFQKNVIVI